MPDTCRCQIHHPAPGWLIETAQRQARDEGAATRLEATDDGWNIRGRADRVALPSEVTMVYPTGDVETFCEHATGRIVNGKPYTWSP